MFYKHENDKNWQNVALENLCKKHSSNVYRVEYTVPNAHLGEYICQIQSKSDFDVSEKSQEKFVSIEAVVSSSFSFTIFMDCLNLFTA